MLAAEASADLVQAVLAAVDPDAVEKAAQHQPWLRAFKPDAEVSIAEEAGSLTLTVDVFLRFGPQAAGLSFVVV